MSEKHSIVIEEYLLLLYQLRGAGERLKAVTLAQRLKSSAPTVHATLQRKQIVIFSEGESVSNQSIPGLWGDFTKAVKNLLVQIAIGLKGSAAHVSLRPEPHGFCRQRGRGGSPVVLPAGESLNSSHRHEKSLDASAPESTAGCAES